MAGIAAFGTLLKMGSTPATIANVTSISGPTQSAETIDVTAHDSSSFPYREFVPSFVDLGEITFDINFDPSIASHQDGASTGLLHAMENRTLEDWQIVFPDGTIMVEFNAYVVGFEMSLPFDDKASASVTLRTTGSPTWTYS